MTERREELALQSPINRFPQREDNGQPDQALVGLRSTITCFDPRSDDSGRTARVLEDERVQENKCGWIAGLDSLKFYPRGSWVGYTNRRESTSVR